MKTIIAGSRTINKMPVLITAIEKSQFEITEVVSGCADGVDKMGELWAVCHKIPIKKYPANWRVYARSAGIVRNIEMGNYADALIAVWDGSSRGTMHMITYANSKGLKVYIHRI